MKVESFEIKDWEEAQIGLILDENEDWILVKHIPVDFVIDGFKLYKKEFIRSRSSNAETQLIERVLKLKGITKQLPDDFIFLSTEGFLNLSEEKFGLFEFQDEDETELFYGKVNRIEKSDLTIDMILSDGSVEIGYDYVFDIGAIRAITFSSDYFDSIGLLYKDELKR